jgi:hypothetical protein
VVETARVERAASRSRSGHATELRYDPLVRWEFGPVAPASCRPRDLNPHVLSDTGV